MAVTKLELRLGRRLIDEGEADAHPARRSPELPTHRPRPGPCPRSMENPTRDDKASDRAHRPQCTTSVHARATRTRKDLNELQGSACATTRRNIVWPRRQSVRLLISLFPIDRTSDFANNAEAAAACRQA